MSMRGKTVAVLGGDRRMAEAVRHLAKASLRVRVAGQQWSEAPEGVLFCQSGSEALQGADVALLPVQALGPEGQVYSEKGAQPCTVDEKGLRGLRPGAALFAGIGNSFLRQVCQKAEIPLVEYREADEFATWNSIPSAEGAIQMAMEMTPFTIFGSRSLVLGNGRTGKAVALLLRGLFSEVTVLARREVDFARIWAAGYKYANWDDLAERVAESDLIFNTVPAMVLPREVLSRAPKHAAVIDLASAPGGTDFEAAAELGITAKLAPGLPGIVAPLTAGRIIADLIIRHLSNQAGEEGEQ